MARRRAAKIRCCAPVGPFCFLSWCCSILAVLAVLAAIVILIILRKTQRNLDENIVDYMYIDNTYDSYYYGPLGDVTAEVNQYDAWKQSDEEKTEECVREHGPEGDCKEIGQTLEVYPFTVTNAEDVVQGQKPIVQQLGTIYAKKMETKSRIDTALWDATGVAHYYESSNTTLDPDKCDAQCNMLLDKYVVVPNPVWITAIDGGNEAILVFNIVIVGIKQTVSNPLILRTVPNIMFGISITNFALSEAFRDAFLDESDPDVVLANIAVFVRSLAVGGDSCTIGELQDVPRADCERLYGNFWKVWEDDVWPELLRNFEDQYGVGPLAMPIFIRDKVRNVLGFNGATIVDPITKKGGNYKALAPVSPELVVEQMAETFGEKGVAYQVGVKQCFADPDCGVGYDADDPGNCTISSTCDPLPDNTGYTVGVPGGRIYTSWNQVGKSGLFDTYKTLEYYLESRQSKKFEWKGENGGKITYDNWKPKSQSRRLENCAGDPAEGSKGIDCDGPVDTARIAWDRPVYYSPPLFKSDLFEEAEPGQVEVPYAPLDRITLLPCEAGCPAEADDGYDSFVQVGPQTGRWIGGQAVFQLNARVGKVESRLQRTQDALIPVVLVRGQLRATVYQLNDLQKVQDSFGMLARVKFWSLLALLLLCSMCALCGCLGCGLFCRTGAKGDSEDGSYSTFEDSSYSSWEDNSEGE